MKKTVVLTLIIISIMALAIVCVQTGKAQSQDHITINGDGNITPSTVPIQKVGDVYSITNDVILDIWVYRSNAILDGNGHAVEGAIVLVLNALNVTVKNLVIANSYKGIGLTDSSNVTITNNTITGTYAPLPFEETSAISVIRGTSNAIIGNNFVNNRIGIFLGDTSNNLIVGNNITGCSGVALDIFYSPENTIYHNNFINNSQIGYPNQSERYGTTSLNIWDDGHPSAGNYYSDYQTKYPNAKQIDSSGIGDTPYIIDASNQDNHPLMEPFTTSPPKISLLSPLNNKKYNETSVPLFFAVDKSVSWMGYSLDEKQNITITGNTTIANMTNSLHSIAVYANDTFGDMGASQTITFTIAKPEPFPIATVAAVSGAAAVVVVAGLLVYFKKRKPATHRIIEGE